MSSLPLSFVEAVEAMARRGHAPFRGKLVTEDFGPKGAQWTVVVNATGAPVKWDRPDAMGVELLHTQIGVFWNGWLAAIIDAAGGVFVGGSLSNEDSFIAAMRESNGR